MDREGSGNGGRTFDPRLLHEIHPSVPREYFRAVLALNYCYLACLLIHLLLIALFAVIGQYFLSMFNIGSAILFAFCLYLNAARGSHRLPVLLATAEITIHATLCVMIFGWDAGFHYYVLALGVSTFIIPWWSVGRKLALVAIVALLSVGLSAYSRLTPAPSPLSPEMSYWLFLANLMILFGALALIGYAVSRSAARSEENLEYERRRSEELLHNILPVSIAERLKSSQQIIAERFDGVTILFCDLVGFTRMSEDAPPETVVSLLNDVFSAFDRLVDERGLEKIKTIGDAYMVAGGLPEVRDDHAKAVASFALEMQQILRTFDERTPLPLSARIGIHSGSAVAGVIGSRKFAYDVWGDTVNTASRMESHSLPGRIQITEATWMLIRDEFACEPRGTVDIKGKGAMKTYWLLGESH